MNIVYKIDSTGVYIAEEESKEKFDHLKEIYKDGELVGYLVDVPMKERFYEAKFDVENFKIMYKHYLFSISDAKQNFEMQIRNYDSNYKEELALWHEMSPEEKNDSPPPYAPPLFIPLDEPNYSILWYENKNPEEIKEILNPTQKDQPLQNMETYVKNLENELSETQLALVSIYEELIKNQNI